MIRRAVLVVPFCFALVSCAELRLQKVDRQPAWLSTSGDPGSLTELKRLDKGKTTPGNSPQFVQIERGTWVFATDYSSERCIGRRVLEKVQVKSGAHKDTEGWMCGASIAHRKTPAL
jgi:hypothetical protein